MVKRYMNGYGCLFAIRWVDMELYPIDGHAVRAASVQAQNSKPYPHAWHRMQKMQPGKGMTARGLCYSGVVMAE